MLPAAALRREAPSGRGIKELFFLPLLAGWPHMPAAGTAASSVPMASPALSPRCPVSNLCSNASWWGVMSQYYPSKLVPVSQLPSSAQLAALLSMAGEEHLLGSLQTTFPHTKPGFYFST